MSLPQALREPAGVVGRRGRCEQQIHVVGHQDVGVHRAAGRCRRRFPAVQVELVVVIALETGLTDVAPLGHMQRDIGQCRAGATCA